MVTTQQSICRFCHAQCGVWVDVENGAPTALRGDKSNPVSHGYACLKGRELPTYHTTDERLRHSLRRDEQGELQPISSETAVTEIAERIQALRDRYGPRSVAIYIGTHGYNNLATAALALAWMEAIESPMVFTSVTIDQPGKAVTSGLHGVWMAGCTYMDAADSWMIIGANPIVSMLGPVNPAYQINRARKRGMKLVVLDPRRTEVARLADVHLQLRPGTDPIVLAGMLRIILTECLHDAAFVDTHACHFDQLVTTVEAFTPQFVAERAGVAEEDLVKAARLYAQGDRGVATAGTGPNMSGHGNLTEYLAQVLMTVCGHWLQAGDPVPNPGVLIKRLEPRAQALAASPAWGFGEQLRIRNLTDTLAGLPTAALADEILLEGEGQIRALINIGGNPLMAWPDQLKTQAALEKLDLLVSIDPAMSGTSIMSDYVIAPTLTFEADSNTALQEFLASIPSWGYSQPYAQYAPAICEPPPGSDVIDDWKLFYRLGQQMGLALKPKPVSLMMIPPEADAAAIELDMENELSTGELWDRLLEGSPIPYETVKQHREGRLIDLPDARVKPMEEGWTGRLDVGNHVMLGQLEILGKSTPHDDYPDYAFRLVSRRLADIHNSCWHRNTTLTRRYTYNPAFMHPADLDELGLKSGDVVEITSPRASILGVAEAASDLRRGVISMAHCWGGVPGSPEDPHIDGGNTGRLTATDRDFDPHTGIPRMSAIPVNVCAQDQTK